MIWFFFVVLLMLKQFGIIPWPWRYAWVWQAFGQLGYFIVLCSVAWTWGPSNVSSQLAHSQQLAMTEEDAVEMTGTNGPGRGVDDIRFTIDDDDDDEEEIDLEQSSQKHSVEAV